MTDAANDTLDPAAHSARAFREALAALSEPGRSRVLRPASSDGPLETGLSPAAFTLLALLSDADAPWWTPAETRAKAENRLAFETGARGTADPGAASFLCGRWASLEAEALHAVSIGDLEYPDRGATLIVEADEIFDMAAEAPPHAARAVVSGPGLQAPRDVAIEGVGETFWPWLAANARRFPLGVDVFVTAGASVLGIPRSLTISPGAVVT